MSQVEGQIDAALVSTRVVNDRVRQHIRVRQDDHTSIGGAHFSGTQVNCHHRPIKSFYANRFANVKRLLQQQNNSRGEILHHILQRKTDREADDAEPGQEGGHIEEALQGSNRPYHDDRP